MGILAVLTAIATPQLMGYFGNAKTQSAQLQIQNIATALELYYMENGAYPSVSAGWMRWSRRRARTTCSTPGAAVSIRLLRRPV